ncbi:MAG: integration host factor subunit alpha [Rickettsiales bacterium]|jgi:integration host factor subunit alpha|nr:integration host factor subunit alpha [Rickettsiales bacterium]
MAHKNVKKIDLSSAVSGATGLSLIDSSEIIDMYFDIIADGIAADGEVKVMGLGTFSVKHKNARQGRNPKTGEVAVIEARNVVSFRPAKNLRKSIA